MGQSGSSAAGAPDTSYQVLSIPASTGKVRPKASPFPESSLKELKENVEYKSIFDSFLFPESAAYNSNVYQFNWDSVGAPLAFFVPKSEEEISGFFRFYSSQTDLHNYSISIACGRHSNLATLTDALVIDMKNFKKAEVNKEEKIGYFGAGLKLGELDHACYKHGVATTAGTNPDTGISGLILGGGFGYLARRHGLACHNLLGARIVLPNGEIVAANETNEYKDLLWGLRGGGGNFGVVTEFSMRLYPQGEVFAGACVYILRDAGMFTIGHRAILQQWRDFAAKSPNELCCLASLPTSGVVVLPYAYTGPDLAEGQRVLAEPRKIGNPFIQRFNAIPYSDSAKSLQWMALPHQQAGNYFECGLVLRELTDGVIDVLLKYTRPPNIPNKTSQIVLAQLGGKIDEFNTEYATYSAKNAAFWINILGKWDSAPNAEEYSRRRAATKKWVQDLSSELKPWLLEGTYNTLSSEEAEAKERENTEGRDKKDEKEEKVNRSAQRGDYLPTSPEFAGEVRKRLVELKRKYDPKNTLRNNKNIKPDEAL